MSMLKELIKETAAGGAMGITSAHSIAGVRTPLGGNTNKKKKKKTKMQRRVPVGSIYSFKLVGESLNFSKFLETAERDFDPGDVISKLKDSEKSAEEHGEDTVAFALEDENGSLVKVWVPNDQADDFEIALQNALSGNDEDEDEENDNLEIAEVLWKLRKDYDIVNIEWGEIPEDQEQTTAAPLPGETGAPGAAGAPAGGTATPGAGGTEAGAGGEVTGTEGEPGAEGEGEGEMTAGGELGAEEKATSILQQVIDAMKADADARKAEAEAKEAEAKAREAEASMKQAEKKVKQEEEVLDMEAYYDNQKKKDDEAKQLAKLAKYRHDIAGENGNGLRSEEEQEPEPEDEELARMPYAVGSRGRGAEYMSKMDLANLIVKALRRQQ